MWVEEVNEKEGETEGIKTRLESRSTTKEGEWDKRS